MSADLIEYADGLIPPQYWVKLRRNEERILDRHPRYPVHKEEFYILYTRRRTVFQFLNDVHYGRIPDPLVKARIQAEEYLRVRPITALPEREIVNVFLAIVPIKTYLFDGTLSSYDGIAEVCAWHWAFRNRIHANSWYPDLCGYANQIDRLVVP